MAASCGWLNWLGRKLASIFAAREFWCEFDELVAVWDFWHVTWFDVHPTVWECVGFFVPAWHVDLNVACVAWIVALGVDEIAHVYTKFVIVYEVLDAVSAESERVIVVDASVLEDVVQVQSA